MIEKGVGRSGWIPDIFQSDLLMDYMKCVKQKSRETPIFGPENLEDWVILY